MFHLYSEPEALRLATLAAKESLITTKNLRGVLGNCSEMHIWRLVNKPELQSLAFPKPIQINGRNYWRVAAIRQWIDDQEAKSRRQAATAAPAEHRKSRRKQP